MAKIKDGFRGERAIVLPPAYVQKLENDKVASLLHITDIGYYPCAAYHYRERGDAITQHVLIYCVGGSGWYEVGGQRFEVHSDQFFVLPCGEPHAYGASADDPWSIYWVHFKGSMARDLGDFGKCPIGVPRGADGRAVYRIELFEEMLQVLERGYAMDNLQYACTVLHHFLGSMKYQSAYREAGGVLESENAIVDEARRYMKDSVGMHLQLKDIAGYVGCPPSVLSHTFTEVTGSSPMSYFNELKVQYACRLLDFTDLKVNQICHKVGVNDCYYFSRMFRKTMGMSPTEYRRVKKG